MNGKTREQNFHRNVFEIELSNVVILDSWELFSISFFIVIDAMAHAQTVFRMYPAQVNL
jgi:hypothetical protein